MERGGGPDAEKQVDGGGVTRSGKQFWRLGLGGPSVSFAELLHRLDGFLVFLLLLLKLSLYGRVSTL